MSNYLTVLEESLQKKITVLEQIQEYNERQRQIFQEGNPKLNEFDSYIEEKAKLIDEINKLDNGFEILYANVSAELQGNREKYATQIKALQELITQVTEKSVVIQAQEARNKTLIEEYFAKQRSGIREGRKSSKAAIGYYKNMSKSNYVESHYLDSKH